MNIASLRTVLKAKWLTYYRDNRHWITRLRVWGTYEERRRPSSSFILGVLSAQEPELMQLLPLVVDLNNNPDRIVAALGLDFNPEDELDAFEQLNKAATPVPQQALKMLTTHQNPQPLNLVRPPVEQVINPPSKQAMSQSLNPPAEPLSVRTAPPAVVQPANPFISPPVGSVRIPLDTAQLSIHEQPDRDATRETTNSNSSAQPTTQSAAQNDRNRDADP